MQWWGVGDVVSVSITLWPHQSVSRRRRLQVTIIMLTSCTWLQHRYKGRLLHVGPTGKSEKVTSTRISWLSLLFLNKTLWREKTNTTRSCYNLTPLFEIMLTGSLLECPISTEDWVAIMTIIHRNHNIIMKWYASRNYNIVYESVSNPGAWIYWMRVSQSSFQLPTSPNIKTQNHFLWIPPYHPANHLFSRNFVKSIGQNLPLLGIYSKKTAPGHLKVPRKDIFSQNIQSWLAAAYVSRARKCVMITLINWLWHSLI